MHIEPVNSQYITHDQSVDIVHENINVTDDLNSNEKNLSVDLLQNLGTGANGVYSNLSDQMHTSFLNQLQAYKAKQRNRLQIKTLDACNPKLNQEPRSIATNAQSNWQDRSPTSFPEELLAYKAKHSSKFLADKRNGVFPSSSD